MDYPGENFLAHTTFTHDENAKVGRRHLQSDVKRMIQSIAISYDTISLLYIL